MSERAEIAQNNHAICDAAQHLKLLGAEQLVAALDEADLPYDELRKIATWIGEKANLTSHDIARELEMSVERIRQYAEEGVAGLKIGGEWRFLLEDIERIKKARRPPGRPFKE